MPIFASEPATTVRQSSPWRLPKLAYGVMFLTVAMATYSWKSFRTCPSKVAVLPQATAKVCIHHPGFALQHAWQQILVQTKTEVRENLSMEAQRSGQQTVAAISLRNQPAETIVPLVNIVASAYSQTCRAEWKLHLDQAYSAAREKVRQAERQTFEAQTRFELLRDRRLQAVANLRPVAPPQPVAIENPRWTEVGRRLADLEERRKKLLLERTPQHPSVQEIEIRIADVRREMASIPPQIMQQSPAASPPSTLPPDSPTVTEVQAAQQAVEPLKRDLQQAQAIERAALTACGEELQIDILSAEPLLPAPVPPRDTTTILGKALVTAATSIIGMGMISLGASLEPALSSIAELQALLPVPVVGVIPATHPGRRMVASAPRRRLARWGWITAGLTVLLAVVWLFFRG
ncbi:MAG: hypothetical protein WCJ35_16665 [Planctomycetota bacterium]